MPIIIEFAYQKYLLEPESAEITLDAIMGVLASLKPVSEQYEKAGYIYKQTYDSPTIGIKRVTDDSVLSTNDPEQEDSPEVENG